MKKFLALILAIALIAMAAPAFAATEYPLTVTTYDYDRNPVEVTFEKAPEKVVAAYQDGIEIMLALGLADRIVCAFGLDDEITGPLAEEFAKINYVDARPAKEEVIAMQPDLILSWRSILADDRFGNCDYWIENGTNTWMSLDTCIRAANGGQNIATEYENILTIGAIFDKNDEAQAIVDEMQAEIDKVNAYVTESGVEPLSVAILEDETDSYRVYGHTTIGGNVAEAVGATLAVGAEDSENIGAEDLLAANPDVIFMVWYNGWLGADEVVASVMENPALQSLDAVKNGKVYALNLTSVYCPGLHLLDGIKTFAEALYPELYA
ncbi:MAG: ABC transporter substrate-binding protein [Clostridia bacterium]|nr:ABC transporter substrate-binding protein [Clostridia bacterium]